MSAQRGSKLLVKRWNGTAYETVLALRTKTINIDGNSIDVTTDENVDANDEIWRARITGVKDFSISGEGIAKATSKAMVQAIYNDFATGAQVNYEIVVPNFGTFIAPMIVASMSIPSSYDDVISTNISLESADAPAFTAEA